MIRAATVPGAVFGDRSEGDARTDGDARALWSARLGIPDGWATMRQVHGNHVERAQSPRLVGDADAIVTDVPGLPVVVATADCLPIVLHAAGAVSVVHAGWRGIAAGIVPAAVHALDTVAGSVSGAVIGPHIGPCCYEVGPEVVAAVGHESSTTWGTTSVDIGAAAAEQLEGIPIERVAACTFHDNRYASFRRDGTDERQVTVAWLPPA